MAASSASRSEVDEDKCFFGKITSDEADNILKNEGGEEGTFLIRESCSSPGNYVLSFIAEGHPIHILIQKYREDAFFSLVIESDSQVFHGLDKLVGHYTVNPVGLHTTLNHPCNGDSLPAEARLHGASSLLHRSTSQGNMMVVSELLKCGYRKLDDKNNQGQTALHIACMKGYKEIAAQLLKAGAFVEARNEEGITPLHLASRHNKPGIVRLLVETSNADIQARAAQTDSVALHEAAIHGNIDCIRTLLALGAPSCPRNALGETPMDLACNFKHKDCYSLLVNHRPFMPKYKLIEYYHGNIERHEARTRIVESHSGISGVFLLRQSSRKHSVYVLTLYDGSNVFNYEVSGQGELFCIDDGPYFGSLETMVDHYIRFIDGLPCGLIHPLSPPLPIPTHLLPTKYPPHILLNEKDLRHDGNSHPLLSGESGNHDEEDLAPLLRVSPLPTTSPLPQSSILPPQTTTIAQTSDNYASPKDEVKPFFSHDSTHTFTYASPQDALDTQSSSDVRFYISSDDQNLSTYGSHTPDIVVTKSRLSPNLIDLWGDGGDRSEKSPCPSPRPSTSPQPSTSTSPQPSTSPQLNQSQPSRDSLRLDLQSLRLNSPPSESVLNASGSSPTMDGNRTHEILGAIDMSRLTVGQTLGQGEFGSVLQGVWLSPSGDKIDVAVKMLHDDDKVNKENFLKEAEVMMNLNHLYIVKLVGVCHGPPVAMVQELMSMGSLLNFLLDHEAKISPDFHLKLWAAQIAEGMRYLEQRHFVHRDLAARNILLSSLTLCKISDFGLSRALGVDKDYYTAQSGGRWPLKWYAPESIYYGIFTHNSDVWSYGITLWEMYTFGDQPYGDLPGHKVVEFLDQNKRLPAPEKCAKGVFNLMLRCWDYKPQKRPSFRELAAIFRTQPEYINIKPYFK